MSEGKGEDPPDGGKLTDKMKEKDKQEILLYQEHLEYDTYRVIVQAKRTNENKPNFVSNQKAGQLIGEKVTERANVTEIRRLHRGKLLVVCSSAKTANEIVSDPEIRSLYNPFIPFTYVRRTAVLRDIDDDFDDATLLENIDARQYRILSVQRLNRRVVNEGEVTFVKTRSVKVTFEGQEMPAYEKNKRYSKEMNDVSRQNKRRDIEENEVHHQKENNEAKKMKQSVESENKFQGRRSEYKQARTESGRGVHDEQRYRKSNVNVSQNSNESDFNMEYAYSQESSGDNNVSMNNYVESYNVNLYRGGHVLSPDLG
ncbi:hypothetical protein M8J76_005095 [Diaphorina citri]|nr:hypothetical protein M8J76_005095 [Diaphorina citri]